MTGPVTAFIGLGGNLGQALQTVQAALQALSALPETRLCAHSDFYLSAPIDAGGDDFINAVAQLETSLSAHHLLAALQGIENVHGRERPFPNAPRTLDLDLLLYGSEVIHSPDLQVPHPRLHLRAFVLLPLLELNTGLALPELGWVRDWLPGVTQQSIRRLPRDVA